MYACPPCPRSPHRIARNARECFPVRNAAAGLAHEERVGVVAARDLDAGEELTMSYIGTAPPLAAPPRVIR